MADLRHLARRQHLFVLQSTHGFPAGGHETLSDSSDIHRPALIRRKISDCGIRISDWKTIDAAARALGSSIRNPNSEIRNGPFIVAALGGWAGGRYDGDLPRTPGDATLDLLADLNEPQRRAVTHVDGPLLVLAGAGSGKTRVITRRVAHLVSQGVAPWHILAITFTNKAAGEMKQRVEALGAARGATVSTFHALCARLLREFAGEAGLSPSYSIYDRDDQLKLVKEAMERLSLPSDRLRPASVHAEISRAKNELKDPASYGAGELNYFRRAAAEAYVEYEKLLAANHALDFDDLLLRTARLLRDRPDIRRALGERYRYILIDE
ncbi:MAG TPA: hypothetical protein DCX07_04675, partial [Phycisphaerales bacterium]|nr:hypothetical protein [Phycisphaerales bacterium]